MELYASGNVSPQEKQEVECMSHIYPEIQEELLRTQRALEAYARLHAVAPPAHLKAKILSHNYFICKLDYYIINSNS